MPARRKAPATDTLNRVPNDASNGLHHAELALRPPSPSPELQALRRNWKWAATSQFLTMFKPLLGQEQILLTDIEQDLATGTRVALPRLMGRLLSQLNQDRKITSENWQPYLRRQYGRRAPDLSPFPPPKVPSEEEDGQPEEVDWFSFTTDTKLDSLHTLCEWFCHNPSRIRHAMKDDDEWAQWRIQPVGYDANFDAYWFMGGDRLWIQHRQNQPIRVRTGIKRKRTTTSSRQRKRVALEPKPAPPKRVGRNTRTSARAGSEALPIEPRPSRARATRTSRRAAEEDSWQEIPDEWLQQPDLERNGTSTATSSSPPADGTEPNGVEPNGVETNGVKNETQSPEPNGISDDVKAMLGLDSGSELTELSSDEDEKGEEDEEDDSDEEDEDEEEEDDSDASLEFTSDYQPPPTPPPDFVEWETVCVTRAEWMEFPTRFETSTNRYERALHRRLVNDVLPQVMDVFKVRRLARISYSS
ncbi:hypothetical protein EXIGLDRAFT_366135 [Exidia glandulosa HHB12029]|uniref:WHIM1 domain-containing protein n=1 Tax=Exidia glandulosa HHB12029 TaxID=1314781 RepID=A0A165L6D3_EXIGL|nr:hypothetical protein EXIGLDRAFT_366135 [Exidia glandulosa HHB12029]